MLHDLSIPAPGQMGRCAGAIPAPGQTGRCAGAAAAQCSQPVRSFVRQTCSTKLENTKKLNEVILMQVGTSVCVARA